MSQAETRGGAPASGAARLPGSAWWRIERQDLYWLIALTLVAGLLRFGSPIFLDVVAHPGSGSPISAWGVGHNYQDPSLPGLGKPNDIAPNSPFVFDELYFANDARDDLLGRDYFDPEPPLAKLIIALGIKLFGFNSLGWRFMPALFGTLLIPLMYLLARQLLLHRFFAIAAGVLMAFDGMTFVESRTAVIDIIPIALVVLAYLLFHLHLHADTVFRQRLMIVLTAITLGLAIGSKWTALAAYGTIVVILVGRLILRWTRYDAATGGVALLSLAFLPAIVYGLTFIRYLTITHGITNLPQPSLSVLPPHLDLGAAWTEVAEWHRQTWFYHLNLRADHIFYSPWWSWPLDFRPVVYYYASKGLGVDQSTGSALVAEIFNLGNPLIWWAASLSLVGVAISLTRLIPEYRRRRAADPDPARAGETDPVSRLEERLYAPVFILVAFFAAWLPFARVPRGLFLYHMLGGLPAMLLALALGLTYLRSVRAPIGRLGLRLNGALLAYAYLVMVVGFFLYFYPLWTGLPLTSEALNSRVWFAFVKPGPNWCLCYWTSPG
jgi:dolichyl-phosphate-mannose-protein mannosyltransferase